MIRTIQPMTDKTDPVIKKSCITSNMCPMALKERIVIVIHPKVGSPLICLVSRGQLLNDSLAPFQKALRQKKHNESLITQPSQLGLKSKEGPFIVKK